MKTVLFLLFLFMYGTVAGQEEQILNFLNKELSSEVKTQFENPGRTDLYDTLVVAEPFRLENGVLSIAVKRREVVFSEQDDRYMERYFVEKQEVTLNKITRLSKDINVVLETEPDAVKIYENGRETGTNNLFFLKLCCSTQYSEVWADELLSLFEQAGYAIEMGYWYD